MTWLWLAGGVLAAGLPGAVVVLWQRWRLQRVEDDREVWRTQAKRLTEELAETQNAMREALARARGGNDVLRSQRDASRDAAANMVGGHPELAPEYLRDVLRELAAPETGASAHAEVPRPAATDPAGPRGRGG